MTKFARARIILNAKKEKAANAVIDRLRKILDFEILFLEPYAKGGYEAQLKLPMCDAPWPEQAIALIATAQSFGRQWALAGDIDLEVDLTSSEFSESGVDFAWIRMGREDEEAA